MRIPKKLLRPRTYVYRAQLPDGGVAFTGPAHLSSDMMLLLRAQDPELELIHNRHSNRIEAYRIKKRGACKGEDFLVHQFTLKNKPGPWLIVYLKENDFWLHLGRDKYVGKILSNIDKNEHAASEQQALTIALDFSKRAADYMRRNPVTVALGK